VPLQRRRARCGDQVAATRRGSLERGRVSGHAERVEGLIAQGRIEEAKLVHNTGVVAAKKRAGKNGLSLSAKLPEFQRAKRALDRAATPQRR
jgi:hypothetical protein